jgi:hypothetical protein
MSTKIEPKEQLKQLFVQRSCWILAELALALDYALISVRRFLGQVGYFRSYTHNGKWYTLRSTPRFNRDGLWHHEDIGFSRHGSLTATIGQLVRRSSAGLSARELGEKLQHPCLPVLTHLYQDHVLDRVQVQGEFRYLAIEGTLNAQQREVALAATLPNPGAVLNTQAAVLVLVAYIKQPELSFEALAAGLQIQGHAASAESIQRFFTEHDLKKTTAIPGP